jgi:tetratricopeptide (TPR) repeat protein
MPDLLENANKMFLEKKFHDAVAIYERILKERPDDVAALNNMGYALSKIKDYAGALDCYERALLIKSDDKTVLTNSAFFTRLEDIPNQ